MRTFLVLVMATLLPASIAFSSEQAPPTILSVSPTSGPTAGGVDFTITGTDFGSSPAATIGMVPCAVTSATDTMIHCQLPPGEGTNRRVVVWRGTATSNAATFNYDAPAISAIQPATGPGAGGIEFTVTGSNFGLAPQVTIGERLCTPVGTQSHSTAKCRLPPGGGLNQPVVVIAGGQIASSPVMFNYEAARPVISSIVPNPAPTSGSVQMTINGSNFGLAPSVTVGVSPCPVTVSIDTTIKCLLPEGQGLNQFVIVTAGDQSSVPKPFNYAAPSIAVIDPAFGPAAGGTTVRIAGANFGTSATVTIGGAVCAPSAPQKHTSITCIAPAGTAGPATVGITVGTQMATGTFTYQ